MSTTTTLPDLLEAVQAHLATYDSLPEVVEAEWAISRLLAAVQTESGE